MDDAARLTVGQFAAAAGTTAAALRHHDRIGLFSPAAVDPATGYRRYAAAQLPQARLIARLRAVGVPLEAVRRCLAGEPTDADVLDQVLKAHRQRLESRLARLRGDLHRLDHLRDARPAPAMSAPDLPAPRPATPAGVPDGRQLAADLFNGVWRLLETEDRTRAEDDRMVHMAHASRHHWESAGSPANLARGEWLCSRVYAVLRRPEPALHHARRVLELCREHGIGDWDLAFAHEALARAHTVAGDGPAAAEALAQAHAAADRIADPADRELLLADLAELPSVPARG
jgi:DNA-binding transcriptional MerR regulator